MSSLWVSSPAKDKAFMFLLLSQDAKCPRTRISPSSYLPVNHELPLRCVQAYVGLFPKNLS
jgi:hypothetical protein